MEQEDMRSKGTSMAIDCFGNALAPGLPYARGRILTSTEDDLRKLRRAWNVIKHRIDQFGTHSIFDFSGLRRSLPVAVEDLPLLDDELAPALHASKFRTLALQHVGGTPGRHDVALFNRTTAAIFAVHLALVPPGDVVLGVSAGYTHPAVVRAARQVGARFIETSVDAFRETLDHESDVALVVVTRLAVTYDILQTSELKHVIRLARDRGVRVLVDDAGGARVGPAVFDQPRMLELGVDLGVTGMDKYGLVGPRLGILAGEKALVNLIGARGIEFGLEARPLFYAAAVRSLEQYSPDRVRLLVDSTKQLATALRQVFGRRLHETPVAAQLRGEDILELAMEENDIGHPPIVPYEATAALAMLLLEEYGIFTIHLAAFPPGTSNLLFKFIPPETLNRFGGPQVFADAVMTSVGKLGTLLGRPESLRALLLGSAD